MASYPFDRHHVLVSASLPAIAGGQNLVRPDNKLERSAYKQLLKLDRLAGRFGGRQATMCYPLHENAGKPGYETYGAAYAFEAGDANIGSFIRFARAEMDAQIEYDENDILGPDEDLGTVTEEPVPQTTTEVHVFVQLNRGCDLEGDDVQNDPQGHYVIAITHGPDSGPAEVVDAALETFHENIGIDVIDNFDIIGLTDDEARQRNGVPPAFGGTTREELFDMLDDGWLDDRTIYKTVYPEPENAAIKGLISSDDGKRKYKFDAEGWFIAAKPAEIKALAACGFARDYAADVIADWLARMGRESVIALQNYASAADNGALEVEIDEDDAIAWLARHRSDVTFSGPMPVKEVEPEPGT